MSGILSLILFQVISAQSKSDYISIADNIVNTSLNVQPGEMVVINGSQSMLTLMHEIYVEVHKAGGKAVMQVEIPEAEKRVLMETPIEYLKKPNAYLTTQARTVDCFVNLNTTPDATLFDDVPEERFAAQRQAAQQLNQARKNAHYRSVSLGQVGGIPTYSYAQSVNAEIYDMLEMFWHAVDSDYKTMSAQAKNLAKKLEVGTEIHVTSLAGTDITFVLGNKEARINCGMTYETTRPSGPANTWLPAGEVYSSVDPISANGVIVIPKMEFRGTIIKNLKMEFDKGRIVMLSADENAAVLQKAMDVSKGMKDVLSIFDIGLNPDSRPIGDYLSYEMAGIVTLGIGDNSWTGGDVESDFSFSFHLKDATVKTNEHYIVTKGEL
jgi:leucyl aminopeptidase (aminopeptidase T)